VQDQVGKLATWLAEAGHEAVVIGPGRESVLAGSPPTTLLGPTVGVRANRSTAPILLDPRVVRSLRSAVEGCDVVHVHEPLMPAVGPAAMLGLDLPEVATLHADPSPAVRRLYRTARPLVRRVLGRAAVVTAVSPVAASAVGPLPVRLVPNGIDVAGYTGNHRGVALAGQVAFVGRDEPRKGLGVLLEAWPRVVEAVPGSELVVVGADAPAGHGRGGSAVRFLGRVSDEEKRRVLGESAVLCAPNTGGESFGIVLVEAMAAGCVVVASALPGFVHVLGDAGVLVSPEDPAALAAAVTGLLGDPARLADLADRSRTRVRRFDREVVLAGYLAAYRDAVAAD
jgi:phosphatidylinositol alpha-mannosyltransferase